MRILVLDGHPDRASERFVHALASEYARGAREAGHEVKQVRVAELDFTWLRSAQEFASGQVTPVIAEQQQAWQWAQHVALLFPLWLGGMPALLKAYLEQVMRPNFAFQAGSRRGLPKKLLSGKSARIIVTMGMPSTFYSLYYRAHTVRALERNILNFVGVDPVRVTLIGQIEAMSGAQRKRFMDKVAALGARAA